MKQNSEETLDLSAAGQGLLSGWKCMGCRERSVRRQGGKSMGLKVVLKVGGHWLLGIMHMMSIPPPFFFYFLWLLLCFFFQKTYS